MNRTKQRKDGVNPVDVVIGVVTDNTVYSEAQIKGRSRREPLVSYRMLCAYLLWLHFDMKLADIGEAIGGRTTAWASRAISRIEADKQDRTTNDKLEWVFTIVSISNLVPVSDEAHIATP